MKVIKTRLVPKPGTSPHFLSVFASDVLDILYLFAECSSSSFRAALSTAREVHLPRGPLYRVAGTAVSIPCSVSEYEGPTLQHFEWFLYRPTTPDISIGMVSTKDPKFPYAIFGPRVQAGDVSVRRVRGDAVELHIKEIRLEDRGVYECYTPTTDSKYHGNYSAKVELKGIPVAKPEYVLVQIYIFELLWCILFVSL